MPKVRERLRRFSIRIILLTTALMILRPAGGMGETVQIPEGTMEIEAEAFSGCAAIREVQIPDSVVAIGENAFEGCGEALLIHCGAESTALEYARENQKDYMAETEYRALIIGQNYTGTNYALNGPNADRSAMSWCLQSLEATAFTVRTERNLSADEMTEAIADCFAEADDTDVSLFFYSGHGDSSGNLIGADSDLTPLTPSALRAALDGIPGRKIVIVDACYSGKLIEEDREDTKGTEAVSLMSAGPKNGAKTGTDSAGEQAETEDTGSPGDFVSAFQGAFTRTTLRKGRGALSGDSYFVITAAHENEASQEGYVQSGSSGKIIGFFTYGFCLGCGWNGVTNRAGDLLADANGDGAVSIQEAFAFADRTAKEYNQQQSAAVWPAGCRWFAPFRN